ncbi:hypothetical protein [Myroides odoratimimus]|uniref:hypothetical protein n=1 Tax=Myroides odoratimimus TaxID=76832 RepID=UPI002576BCCC|nr:hypothetical protein [Myroides odoratimimus]MDM1086712.1 hypothetical protein [Myroides odoratimimus]
MSEYRTKEIIETSLENVTSLKSQLERIEKMRLDIEQTLKQGKEIQEKFSELANDFTNKSNDYLSENQTLLQTEILEFSSSLSDLDNKIEKLDSLDLETAFINANKEFSGSLNDLFDKRFEDLHLLYENFKTEVSDLNKEVDRLEKIDLEKHFDRHQDKLSSIVNTLTNISSTLISINENHLKTIKELSDIKELIVQNSKELSSKVEKVTEDLKRVEALVEDQAKKQDQKIKLLMGLVVVGIIVTIVLKFI